MTWGDFIILATVMAAVAVAPWRATWRRLFKRRHVTCEHCGRRIPLDGRGTVPGEW